MSNMVRARVTLLGIRTLLQHHMGPEGIPLEKGERSGVAGNDPEEWRKSCMVMADGQLYIPGTYIFGVIRNGSRFTKKGKSNLLTDVQSTLQVEEDLILLGRQLPKKLTVEDLLTPADPSILVFISRMAVKNPSTKGRNIRYRLATRAGWKCRFVICWDKTIISREQMKAILRDAGVYCGLGDGTKIGCGRFQVVAYRELEDAEETPTARIVEEDEGEDLEPRREKVHPLPNGSKAKPMPHRPHPQRQERK